jgi:hypothetical protein
VFAYQEGGLHLRRSFRKVSRNAPSETIVSGR